MYYNTFINVKFTFVNDDDTLIHNSEFHYDNANHNLTFDDCGIFLSRYREKKTKPGRKEFLNIISVGNLIYSGIAYREASGKARYCKSLYDYSSESGVFAIDVTVENIVANANSEDLLNITAGDVIYYDMILQSQDGSMLDKVRYMMDDRHFANETSFLYRNSFGGAETLTFTGKSEKSLELNGSYADFNGINRKYYTKPVLSERINTGYLSESLEGCMEDLIRSDKVFLIKEDLSQEEITVTAIEIKRVKNSNEAYSYYMTYRPSAKDHLDFRKCGSVRNRIFDKSFDETFE